MNNNFYAIITKNNRNNPNSYDFISTLAHEFAGQKEVLGYLDLKNAVIFKGIEEVIDAINNLPLWARETHVPYKISDYDIAFYAPNLLMEV